MSKLLSKAAARAASTSAAAQTTKAAGDISSVFPSLRPDYQPEPLPPRFRDLKRRLFEKNEKALTESWKRLLPSLEEEVEKIRTKGSDVSSQLRCFTLVYSGLARSIFTILRLFPL
jgi:glucuronate isomerase